MIIGTKLCSVIIESCRRQYRGGFDACTFGTHMFLASLHLCDLEYCHTIDHAVARWLIVED
jgi:hypothetical protein